MRVDINELEPRVLRDVQALDDVLSISQNGCYYLRTDLDATDLIRSRSSETERKRHRDRFESFRRRFRNLWIKKSAGA